MKPEPNLPSVYDCILDVQDPIARTALLDLVRDYCESHGGIAFEHRMRGAHRMCLYYESLHVHQIAQGLTMTHQREALAAARAFERAHGNWTRLREDGARWARNAYFQTTRKRYAEQRRAYDEPDNMDEPLSTTAASQETAKPTQSWQPTRVIELADHVVNEIERERVLSAELRERKLSTPHGQGVIPPNRELNDKLIEKCINEGMTEEELQTIRQSLNQAHPRVLPEFDAFARQVRSKWESASTTPSANGPMP
jgi:hypothetical protein